MQPENDLNSDSKPTSIPRFSAKTRERLNGKTVTARSIIIIADVCICMFGVNLLRIPRCLWSLPDSEWFIA